MKLGLADLDQSRSAVLNSLRSPESQRGYRHSIDHFIRWYCSEPRLSFNKTVVTLYRIHLESRQLAPGTINVRLAAVRRLAYEAADSGLLSPELAAGIRRVKGAQKLGVRLGNWLTAEEARRLWQAPETDTLKGKRDQALLAVLLGCGLGRRELAELTVDLLQRREDHWAIVDLVGKGGRIRTVPVPDWVKQTIDDWLAAARITTGRMFRCVCRAAKAWGEGMTERVVWHVVKQYAAKLGLARIAPHDLRRSCARLCYAAGGEVEQIQFLLDHVSVQTTEKYLGSKQRLREAVNDRIGIEP
jgi:site-specific recombinase XerD